MSDRDPGDEAPASSAPASPPPGVAGPPRGFAGPLPPAAVPQPPTAPPRPAPTTAARRRPVVPLLLLVVAVALIAFGVTRVVGGSDDDPDPAAAAAGLATTVDARAAGPLCSMLTDRAKAEIEAASGSACRESLRVLLAAVEAADPGPLEVTEVDRDGDRATAHVRWALGEGTIPMELDGDAWRATSLDDLAPDGGATGPGVASDPTGSAQACLLEQRTVETAVAAFEAMNGDEPSDGQALVDAGLLREAPTLVTVRPDGSVVPAGPCT